MQKVLIDYLKDYLPILNQTSGGTTVEITGENVFQKGNKKVVALLESLLDKLILEGSEFRHKENLESFLDGINAGKKGIIFAEHYSNLDYTAILGLMKKTGEKGRALAEKCVAIAGMKLSQDNKYVAAFASAYDRIFIYPSRTLESVQDPEKREAEKKRSRSINIASMRAFEKAKSEGRAVLVFPSGTRYRPGYPETKKGLKEIDAYVKSSDIMLLVSINGNCLAISESGNMMEDIVQNDKLILDASPVINCAEFRDDIKKACGDAEKADKKQAVVDRIMAILEEMHDENEKGRL